MTTRRLSVLDAAEHLGVSVNAVRMRVRRGTLASERDEKGSVWVLVADYPTNDSETTRQTNDPTSGQIEDLREQLAYLREIIATRDEELRRKDHIIMQMAQRLPELETSNGHEEDYDSGHESHEEPPQHDERPNEEHTPSEAATEPQSGSQQQPEVKRSWWRRLFGG